jgi:DUF4097 and DUF4098 domain-containing protein YvlB
MRVLICLLSLAWLVPAGAQDIEKVNGSIRVAAGQTAGKLSTVNGSIQVEAKATVGDAETVNGRISLGDGASAGGLETVNGAVELGAGASAANIETVNGRVTLGADARVKGGVETVNGAVTLGTKAQVDGKIATVDGNLTLQRGARSGPIVTTNGDIDIGPEAHVQSIEVAKGSLTFKWFGGGSKPPRIVIGPGATVSGRLKFHREVQLFVSESAKIGAVTGAEVQRFKGKQP